MRLLTLLITFFLGCLAASAQTNERLYEDLDFRFVTPGARAIAMGKSFVGLADDATAAYSNPAGLSNLLEQEISIEMNSTRIQHHRSVPSDGTEEGVFGDRVTTPSFFSYAAPVGNFTLSGFRNVVQDYQEDFQFRGRFIPSIGRFENGAFGQIDIRAVNYGLGVSYLPDRRFSLGGSIVYARIDADTHGGTGNPESPRNTTTTEDSDGTVSAIFGILYKPRPDLSFGFVYAAKSVFQLTTRLNGQFFLEPGNVINMKGAQVPIDYVIPDRFSAGASWKPLEPFTVCLDVSYIRYSQQVTENFLVLDFIRQLSRKNYYIEDVVEVHGGAEYRFYTGGATFAVRAGAFTSPRHPLRFRKLADTPDFAASVEGFRFNTLPSDTDVGGTFGAGVAISNRVQIDGALSLSRNSDEVVLSFVLKL